MDPSKVTIIVLNWNKRDALLDCLEGLRRADLRGASVMVVDNGSRDGSADAVRARFPDTRVVGLPENRGYAGGNNAGMRLALDAGAEAVVLLNNDTVVARDFLAPLLAAVESPMTGGACSAIHRADRPEMLDVAYSEVRFAQRNAVLLLGVNSLPGHGFETRCEIQIAVGCCLLLRADALRHVGLFDERYFAYHEDVDWCLRAHRLGYRLYYEPFSRVFHRPSSSTAPSERPPDSSGGPADDDLPNAEPLPWNPVRTYLGARNLIRLLRTYATPAEQRSFVRSCLYEMPLEFFAVLYDRQGWMRLGRWGYGDVAHMMFVDHRPPLRSERPLLARLALLAVSAPIDLLWTVPRLVRRARAHGRLTELRYQLSGFWDGVRGRPLPLEWLGLR
jgi:GT2 family glycosyltransferase